MNTRLFIATVTVGCFLLAVHAVAQPRDTLTTEQLLERRGGIYKAMIHPAKYLALDVNYRVGGFRRYRFFEGDEFRFRARGEWFREEIYEVTDSSFVVLMSNEVMNRDEPVTFRLNEVDKVHISRRIPFVSAAGTLFPIAGGVYLLADLINQQGFVSRGTGIVTGSFILSGVIFHRLSNPRFRINKNHRLRVLKTY